MDLILKNKIIETSIKTIVETLRYETGSYYFNYIGKEGFENLRVTCPYHHEGQESHPSAAFYNSRDAIDVEYGFFKCFTCGKKVPLYSVVGYCFNKDDEYGKNWLIDNFGSIVSVDRHLRPIKMKPKKAEKIILDESILNDYNYFHPYMTKRKLTPEVVAKYKVGYDPATDAITFPCWDYLGNLVAINRRSVNGKQFELVSNVNKEIYLLNFAIKDKAASLYICESQINALTIESYYPEQFAVALLGTGTKYQYNILKKLGIRSFILCLDGDEAGRSGTLRFIKALGKNAFIGIKDIPDGKDVNDLSKEEFDNCKILSIIEWAKKYNKKIS